MLGEGGRLFGLDLTVEGELDLLTVVGDGDLPTPVVDGEGGLRAPVVEGDTGLFAILGEGERLRLDVEPGDEGRFSLTWFCVVSPDVSTPASAPGIDFCRSELRLRKGLLAGLMGELTGPAEAERGQR